MAEPLDTLRARLDALLGDAFDAWAAARGKPEAHALAALHDGLLKTQRAIRGTGEPPTPAKPPAGDLPLFSEER